MLLFCIFELNCNATERYGISQFGTIYIANDVKYDVRLRTPSSILDASA